MSKSKKYYIRAYNDHEVRITDEFPTLKEAQKMKEKLENAKTGYNFTIVDQKI